METTYLNPLNNWTRESIPAEIINKAEERIAWLNSSDNGYKRGLESRLISVNFSDIVTRLSGNLNNRDTADKVTFVQWSYTVEVVIKVFKNGKEKTRKETYFLAESEVARDEVGQWLNPEND